MWIHINSIRKASNQFCCTNFILSAWVSFFPASPLNVRLDIDTDADRTKCILFITCIITFSPHIRHHSLCIQSTGSECADEAEVYFRDWTKFFRFFFVTHILRPSLCAHTLNAHSLFTIAQACLLRYIFFQWTGGRSAWMHWLTIAMCIQSMQTKRSAHSDFISQLSFFTHFFRFINGSICHCTGSEFCCWNEWKSLDCARIPFFVSVVVAIICFLFALKNGRKYMCNLREGIHSFVVTQQTRRSANEKCSSERGKNPMDLLSTMWHRLSFLSLALDTLRIELSNMWAKMKIFSVSFCKKKQKNSERQKKGGKQ